MRSFRAANVRWLSLGGVMGVALLALLASAVASAAQGGAPGASALRHIGDVASFSPAKVSAQGSDAVASHRLLAALPQPPFSAVPGGWRGDYYNNTSFSGTPALTRTDPVVNFDWDGSPAPGVRADYFSVRWTGSFTGPAGTYSLAFLHDDYGRLFVDGQQVMSQWYMQVPTRFTANVALDSGQHTVTIEYYSTWGKAVARLDLAAPAGAVPTSTSTPSVPAATPTSTPAPTATPGTTSSGYQGGDDAPPTSRPATPTSTPSLLPTGRSAPAPTSTPPPVPTDTPAPAPTNTPVPPPTNTPAPVPTDTPAPAPTNTPAPAPTAPPVVAAGTRDKYAWPCAATSIWNMPIGSGARYVPANIQPANGWGGAITTDDEIIGLNPNDPLKPLNGGALVHVAPWMSHDGSWNGVAAFLKADGNSVAQGQPLRLSPGGNPSWSYNYPTVDIRGDCIAGAHGGSGLSSFAGSIRKGELSSSQPLRHALKVNLYAKRFLSQATGGYRWPASHADSYALSGGGCPAYGGGVPALRMGSLLALPPGTNLSWIGSPRARKIAQAMMDYGAYVVDDTCWDVHAVDIEAGAEFGDGGSFNSDLQRVFTMLAVVDNNSPSSIGGGGTPRVPLAPPIGN